MNDGGNQHTFSTSLPLWALLVVVLAVLGSLVALGFVIGRGTEYNQEDRHSNNADAYP